MNALESRKRLLIAESELNRAQLVGEIGALKAGVRTLTRYAAAWGLVTSLAWAIRGRRRRSRES